MKRVSVFGSISKYGRGDLDQGKAEAITLAIQLGAQTLLLIDDQDGRLVARQRGLAVIGTLGMTLGAGGVPREDP